MAFKNEYVLPLEQETSEFFGRAQKALNVTVERRSSWTVDRERDMALARSGGGHSLESEGEDYWSFLDRKGKYSFTTWLLSKTEISREEIAITRQIGLEASPPDTETIACIKEALREYKDWGISSNYKRAQLTLLDSNGKEI
ncbi:MAG: hypothetical protein Q8N54_01610 [Sulfurimicrobium sp.]|nr:hypothetical protein [Sulfurimicrobium sp.]MDP1706086.1 hypothetical protein [Sulfurimicrobium sp.]MDP2197299.1 hypothetical protein [Sulfurimicrobium sp.]MDP2961423.1 hypothetical protein [Sulfurimicrobium sp.]MDP3687144.1 hypothetical protein [Sulfurimicrobium sp.]